MSEDFQLQSLTGFLPGQNPTGSLPLWPLSAILSVCSYCILTESLVESYFKKKTFLLMTAVLKITMLDVISWFSNGNTNVLLSSLYPGVKLGVTLFILQILKAFISKHCTQSNLALTDTLYCTLKSKQVKKKNSHQCLPVDPLQWISSTLLAHYHQFDRAKRNWECQTGLLLKVMGPHATYNWQLSYNFSDIHYTSQL